MKDKRKIVISILSILICIMAIGYAFLAQELTINGRASTNFSWRVEITNIASKDVVGDAVNKIEPSYTATTANFSVEFTQPGDSITYDITVTNKGTVDAAVESITVNKGDNPAITYTTSGLKRGDKIAKNNGTNTLTVKVDYDSSVTTQPASTTNDITVTINYRQDIGQIPEYVIGDIINFAGSNWYVIRNSLESEDYVTVMKETVLTSAELGNYAISKICTDSEAQNGYYGCTETGQAIKYDAMAYYWSDTCHDRYMYGTDAYSSYYTSGCPHYLSYYDSKVREMLETRYLPTIGADNLKEVDGYKIRLITVDELQQTFEVSTRVSTAWYDYSIDTPTWIYKNFGEGQNGGMGSYWTMTYYVSGSSFYMCTVGVSSVGIARNVYATGTSVRPVINLLKSAIE